VPDRHTGTAGLERAADDDVAAFAEGSIRMWANLIATHLREHGMFRHETVGMLTMLHDANEATIRSPPAKASASSHLMAFFKALETS
jgi:hypothetical protein